ncbi:MAG: hypothetical protein WC052_03815 [Patescibacteria group bacterium]
MAEKERKEEFDGDSSGHWGLGLILVFLLLLAASLSPFRKERR